MSLRISGAPMAPGVEQRTAIENSESLFAQERIQPLAGAWG